MQSHPRVAEIEIPIQTTKVEAASLYAVLQGVQDQRAKRGQRYEAALVLTLMLLAKLAGEQSLRGIAQWVQLRVTWLQTMLPCLDTRTPCANTYRYICSHVDVDELNQTLGRFFAQTHEAIATGEESKQKIQATGLPAEQRGQEQLSLDGKCLRGTCDSGAPPATSARHVLALYNVTHGHVLRQIVTAGPGDEQPAGVDLLHGLDLRHCVITADALHTRPVLCRQILAQGGDYLLIAKENQPTLRSDIALLFSESPVPWLPEEQIRHVSKGHGRLEVRHLRVSHQLNDYLMPHWPAVAQVFQLERHVVRRQRISHEFAYGLTSLPATAAPPSRLLQLLRHHWHIENRLHWRRDTRLGEDACRVRSGRAPYTLSALNNAVLAFMDYLGVENVADQFRIFAAQPHTALKLLLCPL
jgi:predicted transposase YbfD/YdcC